MNGATIQLSAVTLMIACVLIAAVGIAGAIVIVVPWFKLELREAIMRGVLELDAVPVRNFTVVLTENDDGSAVVSRISLTGRQITSDMVATWLDENGLVMMPKGVDIGPSTKVKS